ncbi:carbon-nitrogen hydrolase family protein [Iamia sp. SCSIO 61187]|nr:carbon-nitrogen hydrolase family protein [Iamia sp. SCSIO 61187]
MPLAVAQPLVVAGDLGATVAAHAAAVRQAAARVVAFPEMSLTGYDLDAAPVAADDPALGPLVAACAATGALALVGAPVTDPDGRDCIGVLAVDGSGATVVYRKVWVDPSEARFAPGPGPVVIEVDGWRLGLAVCRDTRFAEHDAATAALGMDAYVAGVVHHAHEGAVTEERARRVAADRGVWAATASFAGPTGGGFTATAGGSGIWSPEGEAVARAGPDPGQVVRAVLTP